MNALFTDVTLFSLDGFTHDKVRYMLYEKDPVRVLHENLPLYGTPGRPSTSTQMCYYEYFNDGKVYLLF